MIAQITGYRGRIVQDASKPDGTPRKLLGVSRLHVLGWRARIGLREGLKKHIDGSAHKLLLVL